MRRLISKLELAIGALLLILGVARFGWCQWSLPRHGRQTPHGLETPVCNWGMDLMTILIGAIALLTIVSGLAGYRLHSRTFPWYAAQIPAVAAWGWAAYGLIYTFLIYPG
jgi:hypothetical protein